MSKKSALTLLLSLATVMVSPTEVVRTEPQPQSCTVGDAQTMFQVFPIPVHVLRPRGIDGPKLLDSLADCQYRLFRDGQTFSFSEEDVFVGGVAYLYEYAQLGLTRQEAIAELETINDRVWLAEVRPDGSIGEPVEQALMETPYKDVKSSILGLTVFQHRAIITQLPAGEYLSYWTSSSPGLPDESAVVRLIITP